MPRYEVPYTAWNNGRGTLRVHADTAQEALEAAEAVFDRRVRFLGGSVALTRQERASVVLGDPREVTDDPDGDRFRAWLERVRTWPGRTP